VAVYKIISSLEKPSMKNWEAASLRKNEQEAINETARQLRELYPIQKIILFGSKARGDSDEHSDIDILIITAQPLNWKQEKAVVEILFDIGMKYDVIFSPLFTSSDEWERGMFREFPIYNEIARDGALVQ
jgi:predicted nucleotidyltransferase